MSRFIDSRRLRLVRAFTCALVVAPTLTAAAEDSEAEAPESPPSRERAPVCDTPIKLGATFILHDEPEQSLAMLRTPKNPSAGLYRPGMYVEGYEVIAVEPRGVLLAREDQYCWLRLQPDPSRPQPTPPPRPRRPKPKR